MNKRITKEFNITSKRRWQDTIPIEGREIRVKVGYLVANEPKLLWELVHKKGSKISLCRDVYYALTVRISEAYPELVKDNKRKKKKFIAIKFFKRFPRLGKWRNWFRKGTRPK